ncbi:TetR/AcrR family transcriptional regulator [Syntrophomonas palmitatica]|uniref:TetR/AcrR family transcriptional regulator n=1 Tax=Syntrophomonas palmitatica TaxID=402877 RepID=UPI0006D1394E|nr:TetR/AcrR family transcriptional regulator [Syntrophomonas palmitatica]
MENKSTKEKILLTAFKAFLRAGYRDVSINEIVRELGITKGAFYYYFRSKDALFIEIIEAYCFNFLYEFAAVISSQQIEIRDKIQAAAALILNKLDFNQQEGIEYGSFLLLMYDSMKRMDYLKDRVIKLYQNLYELVLANFAQAQEQGIIKPDLDPEALTLTLITMIEGIFFMSEIFDTELLKTKAEAIINNFWLQMAS